MIPTKSIEDDIAAFSKNVTANRKIINGEGTWLFLTTLGCWSVSNSVLQLIAYIVAFSLFFYTS